MEIPSKKKRLGVRPLTFRRDAWRLIPDANFFMLSITSFLSYSPVRKSQALFLFLFFRFVPFWFRSSRPPAVFSRWRLVSSYLKFLLSYLKNNIWRGFGNVKQKSGCGGCFFIPLCKRGAPKGRGV